MNSNKQNQNAQDAKKEVGGGEGQGAGWTVIHAYTRAQALEDGVLVPVDAIAKQAGIKYPMALTDTVHGRYAQFDERCEGQDLEGRTWDIVWMFRCAAAKGGASGMELQYRLYVAIPGDEPYLPNEQRLGPNDDLPASTHRLVTLKAVIGPGDDASPVITIMLPSED